MTLSRASLLLVAMILTLLAACHKEQATDASRLTQIYFDKTEYMLAADSVCITARAEKPVTQALTIPIYYGGEAQLDKDFKADVSAFVFAPGSDKAQIILRRVKDSMADKNKSLTLNLGTPPAGYALGLISYVSVSLLNSSGIIMSFDRDEDVLSMTGAYQVSLTDMKGKKHIATDTIRIPVEIAAESTAKQGTHFEVIGKNEIIIPPHKSQGVIRLKFIKNEQGHDLLLLRLGAKEGFASGSHSRLTIRVQGPFDLSGTWRFKEVSNKSIWLEGWLKDYIDKDHFPKGTSEDIITFEGESYAHYKITPRIKGDLKNYFCRETEAVYLGEVTKVFEEYSTVSAAKFQLSEYEVKQVNAAFDPAKSEMRSAKVCFRIIPTSHGDILEMTIDDCNPTWAKSLYENMGGMSDTPLRVTFERVK